MTTVMYESIEMFVTSSNSTVNNILVCCLCGYLHTTVHYVQYCTFSRNFPVVLSVTLNKLTLPFFRILTESSCNSIVFRQRSWLWTQTPVRFSMFVLSCPVLSCPVLSCPVLSCSVLFCAGVYILYTVYTVQYSVKEHRLKIKYKEYYE
jgi:hypothetical protein